MKECSRCKEIKSLELFNKNKNSRDGKQYYCKACNAENKKTLRIKKPPKKRCSQCNKIRPVTRYYKSMLTEDGLFDKCKDCCNTHSKPIDKVKIDVKHYSRYFAQSY